MSVVPRYNFKARDVIDEGRTSQKHVDELKTWLSYMHVLPQLPDEQIVVFLLACKDSVEFTKTTITCYFKHKAVAPEFFSNRDVDNDELSFTHKVTKFALMPARTKDNYCVAVAGLRDTSFSNLHLESQIKAALMLVDAALYDCPPSGAVFIINFKGVGVMHITRIKIGAIKKFFLYLQEALPVQLKAIHIINSTYVFDKIMMILKPFMNKELFDLVITHPANRNMDEFFEKFVPVDCMPSDFGGSLPDMETLCEETITRLRDLKDYFAEYQQQIDIYKSNRDNI